LYARLMINQASIPRIVHKMALLTAWWRGEPRADDLPFLIA
jgi:hypothetical protein